MKLTWASRALVSVNEDMPTSNLPDVRPGMIVSKVALTTFAFRPRSGNSACARSASIPTTVCPLEPMNSFGAYVASAATMTAPIDLMLAGTSAAAGAYTPAVFTPLALLAAELALDELEDDELELELPQAAMPITAAETAASHDAERTVLLNKTWISSDGVGKSRHRICKWLGHGGFCSISRPARRHPS